MHGKCKKQHVKVHYHRDLEMQGECQMPVRLIQRNQENLIDAYQRRHAQANLRYLSSL